MKIIFICGLLEPGRCGVGDYTRRLAAQLIKQNHQVGIIALNDKFITEEVEGFQCSDGASIGVYRLPSCNTSKSRFTKAKKWIDIFDPEWVSIQLVLFSFEKRGLPLGLSTRLRFVSQKRRVHLMFHELWLGMEKEAKVKIQLWGFVQKIFIKEIIRRLKPEVVSTQAQLHKFALAKINVKSEFLPLISNIPVIAERNSLPSKNANSLTFVIFGSIYYGAPIGEFAKEAGRFAKKNGIEINVIIIGRNRKNSDSWISLFRREGLKVDLLGEQSVEKISEVFSNASFGLSTTPFLLAEKSGTVMAMREHGLPVICVSRPYTVKASFNLKQATGIREYVPGNLENCLKNCHVLPIDSNSVENVSFQYIQSLSSITVNKI